MSTLLLQAAKTGAQSALRIGAQYALQAASSAIAGAFDTRNFEGPRLEAFRIMSSTDGAPLPRAYGRVRLGGQVIWASALKETRTTEKVGKGSGPTQTTFGYSISFAVALCEGEIAGVERIWANGELLPTGDLTVRVHKGAEDQHPDPVISAIDGDVPAYRGTAYVVFEDFPLDAYGARLPQINIEVVRPVPRADDGARLEDLVTGINLLPSSGEFAYSPTIIEEQGLPGAARAINMNNPSGLADAVRAVDQLEDQLPNCRSVSIISSWFGTDLRMGDCRILPGVETHERIVLENDWSVGIQTRSDAYLVSRTADGNPVYGGTPSDASLIALIRRLKERGFEVNLYPFILMDIPEGNGLTDPYSATEQAAFPWRGRICDMGNAVADARTFFGDARASDFSNEDDKVGVTNDLDFGFRRFILHHAQLAAVAGGVDRFVIGSEMVAMTTSGADVGYPAVTELVALAAEVRRILPASKLTYAADWSEYRGHQDGAALTHHLDPLWASPDIDLVAIDAYFPLSDWRQGDDHLDALRAISAYDTDYLGENVEGGEGYDWFYASPEDRDAQVRTPITAPDYRYKDVRHFWESAHFDRDASGTRSSTPTVWQPEMKPIWFSEIGCPAIDLGSNQPNVFVDPKSSESHFPYFSSGRRDDLIQRNYLRAFISHYRDDPMVDGLHVWCWDARPFPDFPARTDVWADGGNWQRGHWLTGRLGRLTLADLIRAVCSDSGVVPDVTRVSGMVEGYVLDRAMSARAALESLCAAFAVDVFEDADTVVFRTRDQHPQVSLSPFDVTDATRAVTHVDHASLPEDVRLHFIDSARDHQPALSSGARRIGSHNPRAVYLPAVMDSGLAQALATNMLSALSAQTSELTLSVTHAAPVSVGDVVTHQGMAFLVIERDATPRDAVTLTGLSIDSAPLALPLGGDAPSAPVPVPRVPAPAPFAFDLPGRDGLAVGAMMDPFSSVTIAANGSTAVVDSPVHIGFLATSLGFGPRNTVDRASAFEIAGMTAQLDSATTAAWIAGANRFAVEGADGWEIIGARDVVLVAPNRFRCSHLLRALDGSLLANVAPGARVVWLGDGLVDLDAGRMERGVRIEITATAAGRESDPFAHDFAAIYRRPFAPAHLTARRDGRHVDVHFLPRNDVQDWSGPDEPTPANYRIRIYVGDEVIFRLTKTRHAFSVQVPDTATHIGVEEVGNRYGYGPETRVQIF